MRSWPPGCWVWRSRRAAAHMAQRPRLSRRRFHRRSRPVHAPANARQGRRARSTSHGARLGPGAADRDGRHGRELTARWPPCAHWGIGDKCVVMYSGNAGLVHDFDAVLDAMQLWRTTRRYISCSWVAARGAEKSRSSQSRMGSRTSRTIRYVPREDVARRYWPPGTFTSSRSGHPLQVLRFRGSCTASWVLGAPRSSSDHRRAKRRMRFANRTAAS